MTTPPLRIDILIIGAGVIGVATARHLQHQGARVRILDRLGPAGGASYGNAGLVSAGSALPVALPGMMRKVPSWLSDPAGPLVIRAGYFPRLLPWLVRWLAAGRLSRVRQISAALRVLHGPALEGWHELLGPRDFDTFIRPLGHLQVWDHGTQSLGAALEREVRERYGIPAESLEGDALQAAVPGLAPHIRRGLLLPCNGHIVDPGGLLSALARQFTDAGGEMLHESVLGLYAERHGYRVITHRGNHHADRVVVAAGAWSGELLRPLGLHLPLETERGYHAMLPNPSIRLPMPVNYKSRGVAITPMRHGLRVAGSIEFAGLHRAPDAERARRLIRHAHDLLPGLTHDEPVLWMGHRPSLPDSLPILGAAPGHKGLFLGFGHGHFGMTSAPASSRLLSQLVLEQVPDTDPAPYAAQRFL